MHTMFSPSASGVSDARLPLDYRARADPARRALRGVDPKLQDAIHALLQGLEKEHDIVVHTAFVGGGRLLGLWDSSSDWDIYGLFVARQRERRALARACKLPDDLPDTLRTRCLLPSALIEVRLWDMTKFAQLLYANNGDAIAWLRAPGVLLSRDVGEDGGWRSKLLDGLCVLPCPRGGLPGFSRALTAIYQRVFGNLLAMLDLATPCTGAESQSPAAETGGGAGHVRAAWHCSCGGGTASSSAGADTGRGSAEAASSAAGLGLTLHGSDDASNNTASHCGRRSRHAGAGEGRANGCRRRAESFAAGVALPIKGWMYACMSALALECVAAAAPEPASGSAAPKARGAASPACGGLPPIAFDDLLAHAAGTGLVSAGIAAQLAELLRVRRACSGPSAKKAAWCVHRDVALWLDGVRARADVAVKAAARAATAGGAADSDMATSDSTLRSCVETAVFRVLQECGVWRNA